MSLFSSLRILVKILYGPSLLSSSKEQIILNTSELSIGVIKNDWFNAKEWEVIKVFLLSESDRGLDVYSNFSEKFFKRIWNVRGIGDNFFFFFSYSSGKSMVRSMSKNYFLYSLPCAF